MKEIFRQFQAIWRAMRPLQKGSLFIVLLFVVFVLGYLVLSASSQHFIPLYPSSRLSPPELSEVRSFLDMSSIPFEEKKEVGILVPEEKAHHIRMELAKAGIPKQETGKGFELFDTNTWIKGEKELQVLEMRALKGQLEKDLTEYENIKNASVILDLAPNKLFGNNPYKTKASVILTLKPGTHLTSSQQRAITNHLAGAVRGLEPTMVAISDTTGRLYQSIDPEGKEARSLTNAALILEERLQSKVAGILSKIVGEGHFFSTINVMVNGESEKVEELFLSVIIDQTAIEGNREEIERQLTAIVSGYGVDVTPLIDYVPFEKKEKESVGKEEKAPLMGLFSLLIFLLVLFGLFPLYLFNRKKRKKNGDNEITQVIRGVNLEALAHSIEHEDPATIALMLSYVEPSRAEKILSSLPESLQKEVLLLMSEERA